MLEVSSRTYIDTRTGKTMFQMTMSHDGKLSSVSTDYALLLNKQSTENEMCRMITDLCNNVYITTQSKD